MNQKRVLSGVQPTGDVHIGNWLGAIRNWVELQENYETFVCVVDLHAITTPHDPKSLHQNSLSTAALYIACGMNPDKCSIFIQSQISAHSELCWILNCLTPLNWMERMIQFKEKSIKQGDNVSIGLLDYPVLMAADILLYDADLVPVGEDQKQHLELARDIASQRVNSKFGTKENPILKVPNPLILKECSKVMSLTDGTKKMSKSDPNENSRITLLDTPDGQLKRKIGRIRYGNAFEGLMADCAGDMTLGNKKALLISKKNEEWLLSRIDQSKAKTLAFIPSHPFGYTAGKWREWYPDVVAEEGASGTVINELLSGNKGSLTTEVNKYLWQEGWFFQHQRLIKAISERKGSRFVFSGDIHAIGAVSIIKSGKLKLKTKLKSFLVGSVGSSSAGWPSFARGITAESPENLACESIYEVKEENGFTFFNISEDSVLAEIVSCGGHNPQDGYTGEIISRDNFYI